MFPDVVILGGGSAGFMAALALKTRIPLLSVRVIRSKEHGIIGVGEGSTLALTDFLHAYLQVDSSPFHKIASPTWKLGLKFLWRTRTSFNYTFGPGLEVKSVPTQERPNGFIVSALRTTTPIPIRADDRGLGPPQAAGQNGSPPSVCMPLRENEK